MVASLVLHVVIFNPSPRERMRFLLAEIPIIGFISVNNFTTSKARNNWERVVERQPWVLGCESGTQSGNNGKTPECIEKEVTEWEWCFMTGKQKHNWFWGSLSFWFGLLNECYATSVRKSHPLLLSMPGQKLQQGRKSGGCSIPDLFIVSWVL